MFLRSRRSRTSAYGASCPSAPPARDALQSRQLQAWRSAVGKVARVCNEWLAADSHERDRLYRCYLCVLAEEEQAAANLESCNAPRFQGEA
jgi:hypothetical protein